LSGYGCRKSNIKIKDNGIWQSHKTWAEPSAADGMRGKTVTDDERGKIPITLASAGKFPSL